MDRESGERHEARLGRMLEDPLALEAVGLDGAMREAAQRLAETLAADKADVLLHDPVTEALVAIGTSDTPMGRREHELGLDVLPLAEGGWTVEAFRTGRSHLARHAEREPGEVPRLLEDLGVRSAINVPLDIAGERRGAARLVRHVGLFTERELRLVEAVARWIGLVACRAAQTQQVAAQAAEEALRLAAEQAIEVLTRRQQDVARLVGAGLTNEQIAGQLVITPGTTANHVEAILRRLGLTSRVQVATWALEQGLYRRSDEAPSTG